MVQMVQINRLACPTPGVRVCLKRVHRVISSHSYSGAQPPRWSPTVSADVGHPYITAISAYPPGMNTYELVVVRTRAVRARSPIMNSNMFPCMKGFWYPRVGQFPNLLFISCMLAHQRAASLNVPRASIIKI